MNARLNPITLATAHPMAGPYGIGCTCDAFAPCSECARREQIEEARASRLFAKIHEKELH